LIGDILYQCQFAALQRKRFLRLRHDPWAARGQNRADRHGSDLK
jgi:hypothetical protein